MNIAQKYLFWREWNLAKKWLMERGMSPADAEQKRVRLIIEALGYGKSMSEWKRWRNDELDKCLAKFRAIHDGGNLDAQLDAQEQPERRLAKMEAQARNLCREVYPDRAGEDSMGKEDNYLNALSRRINFCAFRDITTEKQMGAVIGALRLQQKRNEKKAAAPAEEFNVEEHLG